MRKRLMLTAGILAVSMSVSCFAWAEEAPKKPAGDAIGELIGSLIEDKDISEKLFGEDGLLSEVLPEGIDLDEIAGTLGEKAGVIKAEGQKVIENIMDKVRNDDGSFNLEGLNLDGLGELAGKLAGAITGSDGSGDYDIEYFFERYGSMRDAVSEYYLAKNSESMETGDAQILSLTVIWEDEEFGDEEKAFIQVIQTNYSEDGKDLRFLSGSSIPVLFTLNWDEESGGYIITDAREAADGEDYAASIEEICAEVGYSPEECFSDIEFGEMMHMSEMVSYMNEHPEYEKIEFEGEMMSAEELDALCTERMMAFFDEPGTDSTAETTVVESVEEAA